MAARHIPDLPGFNFFWVVWPANTPGGYARKGGKAECAKLWVKMDLEPHVEEILKHIAYMKTTRQWRETFGSYIPAPAVYLRQGRWDGADIPEGPAPVEAASRMDRQLETAALMTGASRRAPVDMGEIYDVGQQRITVR